MKNNTIKILKYIGITTIVLLLFFILINSFDEELNSDIVKIVSKPDQVLIKEKNAYYSLSGLRTGKDKNPYDSGLYLEKKNYDLDLKNISHKILDIRDLPEMGYLEIFGKSELCNVSKEKNCISKISVIKSKKIINENSELLARYNSILNYDKYYEPRKNGSMLWYGLLETQRLYHLNVMYLWNISNKDKSIKLLDKDLKFWRMVIGSDVSLIMKMIATAAIKKDVEILSQLQSDCDKCSFVTEFIAKLPPLRDSELSFANVIEREYYYVDNILLYADDIAGEILEFRRWSMFVDYLYMRNAARNHMYEYYASAKHLVNDNGRKIIDIFNELKIREETSLDVLNPKDLFYNPVGKILTAIAMPDFSIYYIETHSVQATISLLKIKADLISKRIKKNEIVNYVKFLPIELLSPITGKPPQYDEKSGIIYFDYIDGKKTKLYL